MSFNKESISAQSIYNLNDYLKKGKIFPIYFFSGNDPFTIDQAVSAIKKKIEPAISSDFDMETITAKKNDSVVPILDNASAFPFGDGKKLLIVKNFELFNDIKAFSNYVKSPSETTVFVAVHHGKIGKLSREPYKTLIAKNYFFEANELRAKDLVTWACNESAKLNIELSRANSTLLIDIVGEDKALVAAQIKKLYDFLNGKGEITAEIIEEMTSKTKEYTIFNLQDAIKTGDKARALEVTYNLLNHNFAPLQIINILTKLISIIAQSKELMAQNLNQFEASKKLGISPYYYKSCTQGNFLKSEARLINATRALLKADLRVKTTSIDEKTLMSTLITEMMQ